MLQELRPAFESVTFLSPVSYLFMGQPVQANAAPAPTTPLAPGQLPPNTLAASLGGMLYAHAYCRRFAPATATASAPAASEAFIAGLSKANKTVDSWEPGWQIYQVNATGQIHVQKGDRQRSAQPGEYTATSAPGMPPQVGQIATLRILKESAALQPGFHYIFGQTLSDIWDEHHLIRIYFHSTPTGIASLVEYLTTAMNRYQVAFKMKTLSDPGMYDRADATVLYFSRRVFPVVSRILAQIPTTVHATMRPVTPLFTKAILPGIGMAEEPNTGESFGMHRCRVLAEAMVDAWYVGDQSVEGRWKASNDKFAAYGLKLSAPHLNAGSVDSYDLPAKMGGAA